MTKTAWRKLKGAIRLAVRQANARDAVELLICSAVCWITATVWNIHADVAAIRAEMAPIKQVGAKVDQLAGQMITRDDAALLMAGDAWRRTVEREILQLKAHQARRPVDVFGNPRPALPRVLPGDPGDSRPAGK